jgi:hypothetical protein
MTSLHQTSLPLVLSAAFILAALVGCDSDNTSKRERRAIRSAAEKQTVPSPTIAEAESDKGLKEEPRPAPVAKKTPEPKVTRCQGTKVLCFEKCRYPDACNELRRKESEEPLRIAIEALHSVERKTLKTLHKGYWATSGVEEPFTQLVAAMSSARNAGAALSKSLTAIDAVDVEVQHLITHNKEPPVAPSFPSIEYPEYDKPEYTGSWHLGGRYEGPMDGGGIIVRRRGKYYHVENYGGPSYYYKIPIRGYVRSTGRTTSVNFGGWKTHYAEVLLLVDKWVYKSEKSAHRDLVRETKASYKEQKRAYRNAHKTYKRGTRAFKKASKKHEKERKKMLKNIGKTLDKMRLALTKEAKAKAKNESESN